MNRKVLLIITMVFAGIYAVAQAPMGGVTGMDSAKLTIAPLSTDTPPAVAPQKEASVVFPRNLVGVRGGLNLSDMIYSYEGIDRYTHHTQVMGMGGLFGHFHLGESNFALRPEISYVGRADSLDWLDVLYSLRAKYIDFRMPLTYNIRFSNSHFSPYLMVAPQVNVAFDGQVFYKDELDYPMGITAPVTDADINGMDLSLMAGIGFDYLIRTGGRPLLFSVEAGYSWGLLNTFSSREILDNPNINEVDRSTIGNPFFGAELWKETRHNRGIELAMRLAIPIDDSWKKPQPMLQRIDTVYDSILRTDTIYSRDTIVINNEVRTHGTLSEYVRKDCYSFAEMYSFLTLGIDVSDKRLCLFNINFDFDKYDLRPESEPPLDEVAMMMRAFPEMRIKIIGHTDSIGSDEYNQKLSTNRSKSVAKYLSSQGVSKDRMETAGFGEKYPIDTNETEEGRFHNRRVEIEVLNVGMQITNPKTSKDKE